MTIKTFCDPFLEAVYDDRRDCHLRTDDVDKALKFFGPGLFRITVNPMYLEQKGKYFIDYPYPENVEVVGCPGVGGWEVWGEVKEDNNSTREGQKVKEEPATPVLNRPDKLSVAKGVKTSPSVSPEHQPESEPSQDFHSSASTLEKSLKTSVITPKEVKHAGGRPKKEGEISRATFYRRQKEAKQGVLL